MTSFQIYTEGENNHAGKKVFKKFDSTPLVHGKPVKKFDCGHRKILRDVKNVNDRSDHQDLNIKKPLLKSTEDVKEKSAEVSADKVSADSENVVINEEVVIQKEAKCEPIERMLPYDEELEDNFEDIMPMNERPTTYLNEILNCRPPIFGYSKSPDSDSSDSVGKDDIDIPQRGIPFESISMMDEDLSCLDVDEEFPSFELHDSLDSTAAFNLC